MKTSFKDLKNIIVGCGVEINLAEEIAKKIINLEDNNTYGYGGEPYGIEDVKDYIFGKCSKEWKFLNEIEMDYGDGQKLANWLKEKGVPVEEIDEDCWQVKDDYGIKYHWNDCYFYPY